MTEFEHLMLLICFSVAVGTTVGTMLGLLISFVDGLISKHRVRKRMLKENNDR